MHKLPSGACQCICPCFQKADASLVLACLCRVSVKESSAHYTRVYAMLINLIENYFLFPVFVTLHCLFLDHMYRQTSIRLVGKENISLTTQRISHSVQLTVLKRFLASV